MASFLLLPFYTSWLRPSEYGCIAILDLTAAVLGVVVGSGMAAAVTRYHFEAKDDAQRSRVWWTGLSMLVLLATPVIALVWLVRTPLARLTLGPDEVQGGTYYQLILLAIWFEAVGQVTDAYMRVRKWSATFVGSSLLCLLFNIALNVYFLGTLRLGVVGLLIGNLTASALWRIILLTLFAYSNPWKGIDWSLASHLVKFGSPLVGTALFSLIMHQGDRYLLRLFVGLDQVGIYSLAYSIGQAINTLYFLPFASIWGVVIYEIAEQQHAKKIYAQVFEYFVYLQMLMFLGVSLFAKPLLGLVMASDYSAAESIVPVVCLAYLFFSLHEHFKVPAMLAKRTLSLLPAVVTAAVFNIVANLLLIPFFGLAGAAWVSVLTFAIFSFMGLWRYRLIDKYEYAFIRCGAVLLGMVTTYLLFRVLDYASFSKWWLLAFATLAWCGWAALLLGPALGQLRAFWHPSPQHQAETSTNGKSEQRGVGTPRSDKCAAQPVSLQQR